MYTSILYVYSVDVHSYLLRPKLKEKKNGKKKTGIDEK